jgi:Rha family phage regulatory protein
MNTLTYDLFPETLLVAHDGDRIYTTSLLVAKYFGKDHKKVLRSIRKAIEEAPDEISRANFGPRTYIDSRGKEQPICDLTHDGFMYVAQGFTGRKAVEWKWKFIAAFRAQERALAQLTARYAHALDAVRPCLRPVVEGTEQGRSRLAIGEPLGKSVGAVTYHRRKARELGLLAQ